MLWNIKASYDNDYKLNFLKRATLQNALGGSATMLITNSDKVDQIKVGEIDNCSDDEIEPYFLRRATYYTAELFNVVTKKNLRYLKSTTTMASLNNNLAPSVFLDPSPTQPMVYVFYTNVSDEKQFYGIDPGSLILAFADPSEYILHLMNTNIKAVILDADQLYSTAGKSSLFEINSFYNSCSSAADITTENRFEITGLENYTPVVNCPIEFAMTSPFNVCVELPPISMGYFSIPIDLIELRKRALNQSFLIYPNPANDYFFVQQIEYEEIRNTIEINIYSMYGSLMKTLISDEGTTYIDISELSAGVFTVEVKSEGKITQTETLIKIK